MSDRRLRELERRWKESGAKADRKAYAVARKRMGLPKLPREVIRHYIAHDKHGCLNAEGKIEFDRSRVGRFHQVHALCSVQLWPRDGASGYGYARTMRKNIYYTEDQDEVTCKSCIKSLNMPDKRV